MKGYEHFESFSKTFEVVIHEAYVAITKRLRYSLIKIAVDGLTQTGGTPSSQCVTGSIRSTDHHSLLDSFYSIFMGLIMVYLSYFNIVVLCKNGLNVFSTNYLVKGVRLVKLCFTVLISTLYIF